MASLKNLTREAVLAACAKCDEMGEDAFLEAHGYAPSLVWRLYEGGKHYPSKAIVGVALGLRAKDFFGGASHTVPALVRLGFTVLCNGLADSELVEMVKSNRFPDPEGARPDLPVTPAAYFASGSNVVGEIRGLAAVGHDLGVAVPELTEGSLRELERLAGSDVMVFVDSGAFSEVEFTAEGVKVVKPIDDAEWRKRLAVYKRLAAALGDSVFLVAPDMVGNPEVTLERLARYAPEMAECAALGARLLVPVHKGTGTGADFWAAACAALGVSADEAVAAVRPESVSPALPCKKAANSAAEVAAFLHAVRPAHVHLLGMGIKNPNVAEYLAPVAEVGCSVSLDSCWITANVGRTNGKGGGPRRFTRARDLAGRLLGAARRNTRVAELAVMFCFALGASLGTTTDPWAAAEVAAVETFRSAA